MDEPHTEFRKALDNVQKETGLGAVRLSRLFGVSRDMMKSLLTGRRRPGFHTISPWCKAATPGSGKYRTGRCIMGSGNSRHCAPARRRDGGLGRVGQWDTLAVNGPRYQSPGQCGW